MGQAIGSAWEEVKADAAGVWSGVKQIGSTAVGAVGSIVALPGAIASGASNLATGIGTWSHWIPILLVLVIVAVAAIFIWNPGMLQGLLGGLA